MYMYYLLCILFMYIIWFDFIESVLSLSYSFIYFIMVIFISKNLSIIIYLYII